MTDNFVAHNIGPELIRFTQSARKHKIGKGRALYVLEHYQRQIVFDAKSGDTRYRWVGKDDRGVELEIIAVATPNYLLVIHVMPNDFRRKRWQKRLDIG